MDSISTILTFSIAIIMISSGFIIIIRNISNTNQANTKKSYLIAGQLLIGIGFICYTPLHPPLLLRIISIIMIHIGSLITYISIYQMTNKAFTPSPHPRLITIVFAICALTIVFDVLRSENDGLYLKGESFQPTFTYVTYCCLLFLNITILCVVTSQVFGEIYKKHRRDNPIFSIKMLTVSLSYKINVLASVLAPFNLIIYTFGFNTWFQPINAAFYILVNIGCSMLLLVLIPEHWIATIASPLYKYANQNKAKRQQQLEYLHDILVQIVPIVQLPGGRYRRERLLVEISNARRIIWSHGGLHRDITAEEEAAYLYRLVSSQTTFMEAGAYAPPPRLDNPLPYYERLAASFEHNRGAHHD